jgi:hypothetical protein
MKWEEQDGMRESSAGLAGSNGCDDRRGDLPCPTVCTPGKADSPQSRKPRVTLPCLQTAAEIISLCSWNEECDFVKTPSSGFS